MSQFFIERPIFAWVVALAITLAGLLAIPNMPVSQYPEVAPPAITINAMYPGASAQDVANSVSSIIENELNGAKGLLYYESVSDSYGGSQITATFAPGTDPDLAQVDVQNRISNVTAKLPGAVTQQGLRVSQSNASFLMVVTVSSTDGTLDQTALADYITRNIQNPVSRVPGVGKFQLFASPRAMRIWVDPDKLTGYKISMAEVNAAVGSQNRLISAGIIGSPPNPDDQRTTAPIVVNGELSTVDEFENIVLRSNVDGSSVRVRDVARVEVGSDNYQFGARLNGKPTAAFAISLAADANALSTAEGVKAKMEELSQFFPGNITYSVPYDTSPYVDISIQQVIHTLLEAMLLVFIVMFVFLQNVRYTLIPALVVPICMMGAFAVMLALGFSINVLTMFAMVLAIGILVDDAIVVVENVERIMVEEGLSPKEATTKAMPQVGGAIVGMTLVLATVFLPLAFMSGSVGVIYQQFSVAMAVSILFSGFLALTFTPALCATILKPIPKGHHESKKGFFGWFNRSFDRTTQKYESWVEKSLRRGGRMMLIYLVLVLALGWMYMRLPTSFLPIEDQGYVIVNMELPAGSTANRTIEVIEKVEKYFAEQPQTENVITVQGFSFNGNGLNSAIAFVPLKDFALRKGPQDSAMAVAGKATQNLLFGLPDSMVFAIVPPAIPSLGNASGFDMRLEDRGGMGHEALMQGTQQLLQMAMQSPVLTETRITGLGAGSQLSLTIDRDKAAALGVDFSEVATLISTSLGSSFVAKFPNMGWIQNVWVQAEQSHRMTTDDIMKLNARNRQGDMVPLSSFVNVSWEQGPVQVVRYNSYESIRLGGSAAPGYSTGEAMAEMERLVAQLPQGFGYEWTGLSYQEKQAGAQSLILMSLAMLVVFMVLAALYESWAIPLSVMLMVPLGILGAVGLVSALGMSNDVYFQVGMITVIGLAAKNAILIVEFAKDTYAQGGSIIDATVEAARLRFRPILMTSFAFILGVVPLAIATGASSASQNAVGLGVLGGMLAATPLAIIFVPTFFVVVLTLFKTKPKLLGAHAKMAPLTKVHHHPTASASPDSQASHEGGSTMSHRSFRLSFVPLLVSLSLAGCSLAPKYERPDIPVPERYPNRFEQSKELSGLQVNASMAAFSASADLGWRQFFRDPRLVALIDIALKNNRDMRIAVERVQEARALYGIQQSERFPTIGVGANAQVQRSPESVRAGGADAPSVSRFYQAGVGMTAFELDFFGRVKNLSEAAYQQFLATDQAQRTVHINLIAQVAEAYFTMRAAEQQRALMEKTLESRQNSYSLVRTRFDNGIAGALDLNQAQSQLATVRADLAAIERVHAQSQNALQLLLGEELPADVPDPAVFGKNQLLATIPVGLPSDLLVRRPDIIGAENGLLAANANVGAARAAFFPNISITGLLGFASSSLGGLFSSGNRFWSYTPQLTVPIFSGGVSGNLDLAKARKNIAVSQYEKTIQTAFREVADALAGEATYSSQLDALRSLEGSASETLRIARIRYESGVDSFLQVQSAEVDLYSAQRLFLQTGLESLMNRVELYKALGGGWLENSGTTPESAVLPAAAS